MSKVQGIDLLRLLAAFGVVLLVSGCAQRSIPERQSPILPAPERSVSTIPEIPTNRGTETGTQFGPTSVTRPERRSRTYPGSGVFVNSPAPRIETTSVSSDGGIVLNFVNAPINEVLDAVLGKILGLNYAIDPDVEGTITIQTSRPLSRESLLPTVETVLNLAGVAIVEIDGLYTVVRREAALQGGAQFSRGSFATESGRGFQILVAPLEYIPASEMLEILEPLAPDQNILRVDETRNVLVLAGTQAELAAFSEAISIFDVDWLRGMSFGMFPLQFAGADALAAELESLFGEEGEVDLGGLISFVPIERLNTILVISPQARYVAQARTWIERLDQSEDGTGQRIYVYYVQNGRADNLAQALTDLFSEQDSDVEQPFGLAPGLEPVAIGSAASYAEPPAGSPGGTEETLGGGVPGRGVAASPGPGGTEFVAGSDVRIIADQENNALLILATPREYKMIESTLRQLDIVPLQVLIQASLFTVTLNDELDYGVRWFLENGDHTLDINNLPALLGGPAFSYAFSSSDFDLTIEALAGVTDLEVISAPELMVLNNQTASLEIGDQVPVATRTSQSVTSPEAPIVNDIQYRDTGVILSVTPRVNDSGLVIMDIQQEVSDVEPTIDPTVTPTIFQRSISSTVAVQSGETVALGGLISQNTQTSKSGVPVLMDIPGLGALFRSTSEGLRRSELIVVITPRVIRSSEDARFATDELRRRMGTVHRLIEKFKPIVESESEEVSAPKSEPSPGKISSPTDTYEHKEHGSTPDESQVGQTPHPSGNEDDNAPGLPPREDRL